MSDSDVFSCLFCRIVARQIPADVVYEDDQVLAFRDISPQAPVHVVVIPKLHFRDAAELTSADQVLTGAWLAAAAHVAELESLTNGFRLAINTGADGGQTVMHVHAHVLGGRTLTWPPG